jgi:hypothetical protein
MATTPEQIPTSVFAFGLPTGEQITAGDTWTISPIWREKISGDLIDFTGWTPVATVVDADKVVLETAVVTPSPGDATGSFTLTLSTTQTANLVGTNTLKLVLTAAGPLQATLICSPFTVTDC